MLLPLCDESLSVASGILIPSFEKGSFLTTGDKKKSQKGAEDKARVYGVSNYGTNYTKKKTELCWTGWKDDE